VTKLVGDLVAGGVISSDVVEEIAREQQTFSRYNKAPRKPANWYYIDYEKMVNMAKWKVDRVGKMLETKANTRKDNQGYHCPACDMKYSALDVGELMDFNNPGQLTCTRCKGEVEEAEVKQDADEGAISRFNKQISKLTDCLSECDKATIPDKRMQVRASRMAFAANSSDVKAEAMRTAYEAAAAKKRKETQWSGRDYLGDINATLSIQLVPGNDLVLPMRVNEGDMQTAYDTYYLLCNAWRDHTPVTDDKETHKSEEDKLMEIERQMERKREKFYIVDLKDNLDDSDDLDEEADGSDTDAYTEHSDDSALDEPIDTDQYWTDIVYDPSTQVQIGNTARTLSSITADDIKRMTDAEYNTFFDAVTQHTNNFLCKSKRSIRRQFERQRRAEMHTRRLGGGNGSGADMGSAGSRYGGNLATIPTLDPEEMTAEQLSASFREDEETADKLGGADYLGSSGDDDNGSDIHSTGNIDSTNSITNK
ncbi:hypothetical protein SARC_11358, partial [Sphaeroforma arctica JP610]